MPAELLHFKPRSETLFRPDRERLATSVHSFVDIHADVQRLHGNELTPQTERFLREGFIGIVSERHQKGVDSGSPKVKEAISIMGDMLPFKTYGVFCVDGRIKRTRVYGLVPGVSGQSGTGGFIHVPAGEVPGFEQGRGQKLVLKGDSHYADLLRDQFKKNDRIVQLRDAHRGCAAEKIHEERKATLQPDNGLFANTLRLVKEIDATKRFIEITPDLEGKDIVPIVTSYNPETNGIIMGLERQEAVTAGAANGYTPDVLKSLTEENKIIDTEKIIEDSILQKLFNRYAIKDFDWETNHANSLLHFWQNMQSMEQHGLINRFGELVRSVYNKTNEDNSPQYPSEHLSEDEIRERAVLLAANTYNSYLLRDKPNVLHNENIFVITEAENGPYKKYKAFSVFSYDEDLDDHVLLTRDIISDNITRKNNPIQDPTGTFTSQEEYNRAPKIGLVKEVVRADLDWDKIREIDWSDMPDDWAILSDKQFRNYIAEKCNYPIPPTEFNTLFEGMNHLREIMTVLNTGNTTVKRLIQEGGHIVIMPTIVTPNREIAAVLPFIYKGAKEQETEVIYQAT